MCYITYHYQVTVEYLSFWEYGNPFLIKSAMFIRHNSPLTDLFTAR